MQEQGKKSVWIGAPKIRPDPGANLGVVYPLNRNLKPNAQFLGT